MSFPSIHGYQDANGHFLTIEKQSPFLQKYIYSDKPPGSSGLGLLDILIKCLKFALAAMLIILVPLKCGLPFNRKVVELLIQNANHRDVVLRWVELIKGLSDWKAILFAVISTIIILHRRYQSKLIINLNCNDGVSANTGILR